MTRPHNKPESSGPVRITDGGEEFYEYGEYPDEQADEYVEHYPDPFASEEPAAHHDPYLPEYDHDPHLEPSFDGDLGPRWGFEEDSARPRGPPCENCDEYTRADSFGWSPDTGETVDSAVCDDCGLEWSRETGWVDFDKEGDPEVRTDGGTASKTGPAPSNSDTEHGRDAAAEIKEELERLAASDLPIAERAAQSLDRLRNGG